MHRVPWSLVGQRRSVALGAFGRGLCTRLQRGSHLLVAAAHLEPTGFDQSDTDHDANPRMNELVL
ncbi:MAG TPA: hypothetical protein VF331_21400 [Polyangiales bacterium]